MEKLGKLQTNKSKESDDPLSRVLKELILKAVSEHDHYWGKC